ncbi:HU family DNA-binding protein [Tardiphaga sp. 862_B3_N1_1]|uniref:HU family DNA-binding protein n=1 Tax=Tardiphaga sp. 862_B3_N1_1 TaxID=3240763 RepID=UPI003F8CB45F
MSKSELINAIAGDSGESLAAVGRVLDSLAKRVGQSLKDGDNDVTIPGIGKLTVKPRAARNGRNPQTGEAMAIPASKAVTFKAVKALKDLVQ